MYPMSPEDRLRMVVRQQNELRDEMARERMATAASAKRTTARPGTRTARGAGLPHVGVVARHLFHAITGRHAAAPHGVTR